MSAMKKALTDIHFKIPREILKTVFLERNTFKNPYAISIDDRIMTWVIRPRVLVDCDIAGGIDAVIDISDINGRQADATTWVFKIPKSYTQDRSIISVQTVSFTPPAATTMMASQMLGAGAVQQAASQLLTSKLPPPSMANHRVDLIGENLISISNLSFQQPVMKLHCTLGTDEQLSHIKMKYWGKFARLVELAVKSFIYNEYIVPIDMAELSGGASIGKIKEIIDSYNDAETEYQAFLAEKFKKSMFMNDERSHGRYIQALIGTGR